MAADPATGRDVTPAVAAHPAPARVAESWVARLRAGGVEPWMHWRTAHDPAEPAASATGGTGRGGHPGVDPGAPFDPWWLPGAQQLELLRRLNLAGRPSAALVERVLAASAPGRGAPDLELIGLSGTTSYGAAPVDPAALPAAELVRVASGLIAADLTEPAEIAGAGRVDRRVARLGISARLTRIGRMGRPGYVLAGDPALTGPAAAAFTAAGRPPIGPGEPGAATAVVYVLGTDVLTMSADAFTARSLDAGAPSWTEWLGAPTARRRLPPRGDVLRLAHGWAARIGAHRVRIVLDGPGLGELARLVGVRRPVPPGLRLSADAVELARLVGAPLGLLVVPAERARLLRAELAARLASRPGPPLGLPAARAGEPTGAQAGGSADPTPWAEAWRARGRRERDAVRAAGYPVTGDLERLVPGDDVLAGGAVPDAARVLDLAVGLLIETDAERAGRETR